MVIATGKTAILERVQARSSNPWLLDLYGHPLGPNSTQTFNHYYEQLQQTPRDIRLIIADPHPVQFLAKFLAACAAQRTVFLGNAKWVQSEWEQVWAIAHPTHSWISPALIDAPLQPLPYASTGPKNLPQNAILIPTGGTSGTLRFAIHTWETLSASVHGFRQHFHVETVNTCCVLPLYHVSGLMQFMRSFLSGGQIVVSTFKELEQADTLTFNGADYFLSLVPTQLARLHTRARLLPDLQLFKAILLGGAPPWSALLKTARQHRLPIAPTYGMTETASQVATLRPTEFLATLPSYPKPSDSLQASNSQADNSQAGNSQADSLQADKSQANSSHASNNAGSILPHAQLSIRDATGQIQPFHTIGLITIQAKSLALGYCTQSGVEWIGHRSPTYQSEAQAGVSSFPSRIFQSNDLGFLDEAGYLHIVGRQRDLIISGGENIAPPEVEAAIQATGLVKDVAVIGVSDRLWGEAVTAIYVPRNHEQWSGRDSQQDDPGPIKMALIESLNRIKHPKYWIAVTELPCNEQGKVNRAELEAIAQRHLNSAVQAEESM